MAEQLTVGQVSGLHGVRGWVKVYSYTDPPVGIRDYAPWVLTQNDEIYHVELERVQQHGSRVLAKFAGVDDRDQAAKFVGATISVERAVLPPTVEDEYYWADLVGLEVVTNDGVVLGQVERLFETGANDVVVVKGERERLIPWVPGQVICEVDLENRRLQVDWDPEF